MSITHPVPPQAALAAQPAASPAVTRSGAASTAGAAAPPAAKPAVPKPATKPAAAGAAGSPAGAKTPAAAAKSPGAGANAPAAAAPMGSEAPAAGSEAPAASGKAPAAGAKTIAGALKAAGFTDCLKLIEAAGGGKRANDPKTVATVFCPTNQVRPRAGGGRSGVVAQRVHVRGASSLSDRRPGCPGTESWLGARARQRAHRHSPPTRAPPADPKRARPSTRF